MKSSEYNYAKFGFICTMNFRFFFSLIAIQVVNCLFLVKYLARITVYPIPIASVIVLVFTLFIFLLEKKTNKIVSTKTATYILVSFCLIAFLSSFIIPIESLNVDRWSVISSFWDACLHGKYPYFAISHMGNFPGPMPVYFLIFLPFHLIGEIGLASLLAICAMLYVFKKLHFDSKNTQLALVLTMTSASVWYEIVCRSTILTNSILVLLYFIFSSTHSPSTSKKAIILGIVGGLLLSTRNVFGLSFALIGFYFLFNKTFHFKNIFLWGGTIVVTFGLTFTPFLLFYWDDFFSMNPFIVQSSFLLPSYFVIIFGIITIIIGMFCRNFEHLIFFNGILMFVIASIYFAFHVAQSGIENAYFGSIIDLTYFVFCLPFFMYTIASKEEQFLA